MADTLSIRWAIRRYLDSAGTEISTGGIAAALQLEGYRTDSAEFNSVVSAKLGLMAAAGEVERTRYGHCRITDFGRDKWALIQRSPAFKRVVSTYRPGLKKDEHASVSGDPQ